MSINKEENQPGLRIHCLSIPVCSTVGESALNALLFKKSGYKLQLICKMLLRILPLLTECFILEFCSGIRFWLKE